MILFLIDIPDLKKAKILMNYDQIVKVPLKQIYILAKNNFIFKIFFF